MMGQHSMIAQAAQTAAQNVMRRNKLRALIGKGAAGAGGGGTGMGSPNRAMSLGKPIGTAGGISRPSAAMGGGQTLAEQLAAAMGGANTPGAFNASGGGADFQAIPDPHDGGQSPQTLPNQGIGTGGYLPAPPIPSAPGTPIGGAPGYATPTPGAITSPNAPNTGASPIISPNAPGAGSSAPIGTPGAGVSPGGAMIPLGGNLFYDPATDSVVGPAGTPGNAGGATRAS